MATSDVVVVRDDSGAAGANPLKALTDTDGLAGRRVAQNVRILWSNVPTLGQERIGSTLAIAVEPQNGQAVYLAWGDRVGNGDIYTLHVRRSTDGGGTWSGDLKAIRDATCPALAIADDGTVGLLHQQVRGGRWETILEQSRDGFSTIQAALLAAVPANIPAPQFLPYLATTIYCSP